MPPFNRCADPGIRLHPGHRYFRDTLGGIPPAPGSHRPDTTYAVRRLLVRPGASSLGPVPASRIGAPVKTRPRSLAGRNTQGKVSDGFVQKAVDPGQGSPATKQAPSRELTPTQVGTAASWATP
jgi:hypothetical protein